MVDPGFLLHRLGELIADLRLWHYRVTDLINETRASEKYSREILDRTEHQVRYLQEYATADLERYRELQSSVEDLENRCAAAQIEARALEDSAREVVHDSHRVRERCESETSQAEALYRAACAKEQEARAHVRDCQSAVEKCKRILDEKRTALRTAEQALEQTQEALRRSSFRRTVSNQPVDLSGYEAAVASAEIRVASCRLEYESAADSLRMSEEALYRAREALDAAVEKRTATEYRLSRCKEASLCASQAIQHAEDAFELVAVVLRDVEDFSLEVKAAIKGCRELTETATACLTRIQHLQNQLQESWHVFNGASCHIQKVTDSGETGMNCCQKAIVDLGARCLSLARFEETTVADWRQ